MPIDLLSPAAPATGPVDLLAPTTPAAPLRLSNPPGNDSSLVTPKPATKPVEASSPVDLLAGGAAPGPVDLLKTPPVAVDVQYPAAVGDMGPIAAKTPDFASPEHVTRIRIQNPAETAGIGPANEQEHPEPTPAQMAASAHWAQSRKRLDQWFDQRQFLDGRADRGAATSLNFENKLDPFPADALESLHPNEQQTYRQRLDDLKRQSLQAVTSETPALNIGANLAEKTGAALAGLGPMVADVKIGAGNAFRQATGIDNGVFMDRAYQEKRDAESLAEHARNEQQYVQRQLPQTPAGEFLTGQADLGIKMGAAALGTWATGNPKVGTAMFSGLFSADAGGQAYQEARARGASDQEAQQDATFSGVKAAIIAKLPMTWPAMQRETAAVQMAGAFAAGTAITTGDAAADQAWRSIVRGEPVDNAAVERLGMAMLQGGLPAAGIHALHGIKAPDAAPEVRAGEPPVQRPDTMQTPAPQEGDYGGGLRTPPVDLLAQEKSTDVPNTDTKAPAAPVDLLAPKPAEKAEPPQSVQEATGATTGQEPTPESAEPVKTPPQPAGEPDKQPVAPPATEQPPTKPAEPAQTPATAEPPTEPAPSAEEPRPQPVEKPAQTDDRPEQGAGDQQVEDVPVAAHAETVPEPAAPPKTGKLDALESWARQQIATLDSDRAGRLAQLTPEQRRLRGGSDVFDPQRLVLHAIIGAAKVGKGVTKFAEWSKEIVKDIPELVGAGRDQLMRVFSTARRLHGMDEESRAQYVAAAYTVPADRERTLTRVRRLTGQVNTSKAVSELDALRGSMRAASRASDAGYKAGVRDVNGLKAELSRIVKENLPAGAQRQFLDDVAKVSTPGQVALAINKGRRLLADHDVRTALSDLEDLTGTLKVNVFHAMTGRAAAGKPPRVLGDIKPADVRSVDLKTLPKEQREQVSSLLEEARYLKDRLRKASAIAPEDAAAGQTKGGQYAAAQEVSIEQKQRAVEAFQRIDRQVREIAANHLAGEELRVGDKLVARDKVVKEVVAKVKGGDDLKHPPTSEGDAGPGHQNLRKLFGRSALNMDAIASNMVGPDSDAYKVTIHNVRQAQSDYYGEQRRTHEVFERALDAAGIPAGSKKLDDWLSKRESVNLPDLGRFAMTRDEMLDIVATASDPATRKLIDGGVRWNFKRAERETPLKLSPADLEAIKKNLTPGELGLLKAFRTRNDELTGPAMAAKLNLSGWAPDATPDYYPRGRNRKQSEEAGLPEGWRGYMDKALENVSSMEARAQDRTMPLSVKGFIPRVFDHFDDTAKLIHLADPVRNASALWQHPEVTRALAHAYGESMNERIGGFLRDTMMVRSAPPAGPAERLWQKIATNVARAWLQLNPSPMGKNIGGGTVSLLPEFDLRDWTAGVAHMLSPKVYKRMTEGSGVAWARYHGGLYGQYTPLAGGHAQTVAEMTFGQAMKAGKIGQAVDAIPFMEYADSVPLRAAWAASENFIDRTQPGLKGQERTRAVADKFEQALYRTQNGSSSTEISGYGSDARGKPWLAAYLMFKSDTAKKYSLLAMMGHADGATRAKTVAAVAFNALLSGAVGYGIKQGASAIGRAIGGAPVNPDEQQRFAHSALWNAAKDVIGIVPGGGAAVDLVRQQFSPTQGDAVLGNPVLQAGDDVVTALTNFGKAVSAWSQKEQDSGKREEAYHKMLAGVWKLARAGATLGGVPITPAMFQVENTYRAATYHAPDARDEAVKAKEKAAAEIRDALPASVRALTSEREKLHARGRDNLRPAEKERLARLDEFERAYQGKMEDLRAAKSKGDQAGVDKVRRDLHAAAKGVDQLPVDPRMEAVRDRDEQTRQIHESLPRDIRDLLAEHGRLERLPKAQLTREERTRLGRTTAFEQFYQTQVKYIRLARQRGDKAMEAGARERLAAAAKKAAG